MSKYREWIIYGGLPLLALLLVVGINLDYQKLFHSDKPEIQKVEIPQHEPQDSGTLHTNFYSLGHYVIFEIKNSYHKDEILRFIEAVTQEKLQKPGIVHQKLYSYGNHNVYRMEDLNRHDDILALIDPKKGSVLNGFYWCDLIQNPNCTPNKEVFVASGKEPVYGVFNTQRIRFTFKLNGIPLSKENWVYDLSVNHFPVNKSCYTEFQEKTVCDLYLY